MLAEEMLMPRDGLLFDEHQFPAPAAYNHWFSRKSNEDSQTVTMSVIFVQRDSL